MPTSSTDRVWPDMPETMTKLNLNGETDIPAGKISNVVTYLEMHSAPPRKSGVARPDLTLEQVENPDPVWYRGIYSAIGEEFLWFSRIVMPDDKLCDILQDPKAEVFALRKNSRDAGLLELDLRRLPDIEIAFFGALPDMVGDGAGRWLMTRALELAWAHKPDRVWLHTCSFDHPAALPFYIRSGFTPYKRAVEVVDDPRLTGDLPLTAAPQIPIIRAVER
ncbi:MAG: GNAT family N-acetyltransferase [Fimbriimonadaceae bacterium]|nr:GNAT family N-acetyltransferase [Alphaproteobacteria bacterium]